MLVTLFIVGNAFLAGGCFANALRFRSAKLAAMSAMGVFVTLLLVGRAVA